MQEFLRKLKACRKFLTPQQYRTLKGQALAGDLAGAIKGLETITNRKGVRV